jgi:hypothetical protein
MHLERDGGMARMRARTGRWRCHGLLGPRRPGWAIGAGPLDNFTLMFSTLKSNLKASIFALHNIHTRQRSRAHSRPTGLARGACPARVDEDGLRGGNRPLVTTSPTPCIATPLL